MPVFGRRFVLPVVLQSEAAECGLACVAMVAAYHGRRADLTTWRKQSPISMRGATLLDVMRVAEHSALSVRAVRLELEELRQLKLPAILHWSFNHFVVLKRVSRRGIVVHDPAVGARRYSLQEAGRRFTGVAVELEPRLDFAAGEQNDRLGIVDLWRGTKGIVGSLGQVLILSLLIQGFALAMPFYMQIVVDDVLVKHDQELLVVLAAGFLLLTLVSVTTRAARGYANLYVANQINYNMGSSVFHHLIRLPMAYFEKRHLGDIVSRFGSLQPLQSFITDSSIVILIDGVLALATFALMCVYAVPLALVVLASVGLYAVFRLLQFGPLREANHEAISARAQLDSNFMETIRGLQGIKLGNHEAQRQGVWQNQFAQTINANARVGRLAIGYESANSAVTGIEHVVLIYLGAQQVLSGSMTIGMLFAFMAYRSNFSGSALSLVDQWIQYRMVGLHLERLSDITQTGMEPGLGDDSRLILPVTGTLQLQDVHFRFSPGDPEVCGGISLQVAAGEMVALFGPSGVGKTTLLKLMMGLLPPASGQVLVDDQPIQGLGLKSFRHALGAVMQDDVLFSGTLRDNIASFELAPDEERVQAATRAVGIHEQIMALPMGYYTLIGDMGTSLSMGQQQRLMIARALYRTPRILFLDEGTAHIDVAGERALMQHIRTRGITCVYITHSPDLLSFADVVLHWTVPGEAPQVRRRTEPKLTA